MRPEEKKELEELRKKKIEDYKKMVHEKLEIHRAKKEADVKKENNV